MLSPVLQPVSPPRPHCKLWGGSALVALNQLTDSADAPTRARAKLAALTALGAAAEEVAHLAPNDPLAAAVLRGLNERSREQGPAPSSRSVVWF